MSHFETFESWRAEKASHFESFRGWRRDKASHFESSGDSRLREVSHGESFWGCRLRKVSHGVGLVPDGLGPGVVLASGGVFAVFGLGHGASRAVGRGWIWGARVPCIRWYGDAMRLGKGLASPIGVPYRVVESSFQPAAGWRWMPEQAEVEYAPEANHLSWNAIGAELLLANPFGQALTWS